jgi:acylpyruvate hydrolase
MEISVMKPIMNIWCVGRNYVAHAAELKNPVPESPLIFLKAGSCASFSPKINLPQWTKDIHYECELAVQLDRHGEPKLLGLALDLTARSVQSALKDSRSPWTLAKSFTGACPLSAFVPFQTVEYFNSLNFRFYKNAALLQTGNPQHMLFSLPVLLEYIRSHFPVNEGDLVLTGTPSGVGPLSSGDRLRAEITAEDDTRLVEVTWDVI